MPSFLSHKISSIHRRTCNISNTKLSGIQWIQPQNFA
uniref:Uncharacterized protein n=1 Tax=Rhizophora mucronata TaxID=61149 RepID=A0A2P2LEA9_RHIMU